MRRPPLTLRPPKASGSSARVGAHPYRLHGPGGERLHRLRASKAPLFVAASPTVPARDGAAAPPSPQRPARPRPARGQGAARPSVRRFFTPLPPGARPARGTFLALAALPSCPRNGGATNRSLGRGVRRAGRGGAPPLRAGPGRAGRPPALYRAGAALGAEASAAARP